MAKMLAVVVQRADGTVGVITRHRQHRDVDARELFAERTGALPVMVVARMMQPVTEHAARQPRHHRKIAIRLAAFVPLAIARLPVRIIADIRRRLAGYGLARKRTSLNSSH